MYYNYFLMLLYYFKLLLLSSPIEPQQFLNIIILNVDIISISMQFITHVYAREYLPTYLLYHV